jgi:hypothetical protein
MAVCGGVAHERGYHGSTRTALNGTSDDPCTEWPRTSDATVVRQTTASARRRPPVGDGTLRQATEVCEDSRRRLPAAGPRTGQAERPGVSGLDRDDVPGPLDGELAPS